MKRKEIEEAVLNAWALEIEAKHNDLDKYELVETAELNRKFIEKLATETGIDLTALAKRIMSVDYETLDLNGRKDKTYVH